MKPILALDTSCDDTSAAVVAGTTILSSVVSSQISLHQPYGGVFPTVAKLAHQQNIVPVTQLALRRAHLQPNELAGIGVTVGPGLAPALEIGVSFARQFATQHHLPLLGVNHLEGHLLSPMLTKNTQNTEKIPLPQHFPYGISLGIIVSGGHSQFVKITDLGDYQIIGETLDDAMGECLDKIGRMLGLGYPAAPLIEQLAKSGDPTAYPFPLPLTSRPDFNLSFSGLKTHARNLLTKLTADQPLTKQQLANFAASAQAAVVRHLLYKLTKLLTPQRVFAFTPPRHILLGGGVAANLYLRRQLRLLGRRHHFTLHVPVKKSLCGDNAAMIALVAGRQLRAGQTSDPATLERQPNLNLPTKKVDQENND